MGEIIGSEVGRSLSPGFGSIRVFPRRRRKAPRWIAPFAILALATLVSLYLVGR